MSERLTISESLRQASVERRGDSRKSAAMRRTVP